MKTSTCLYCSKDFEHINNQNRKYCSTECSRAQRMADAEEIRECPVCGKTFRATKCDPKKYCSRGCSGMSNRGTTMTTKTCPQCGKQYEIEASRASRNKYCSSDCGYAARVERAEANKEERTCPVCGDTFRCLPSKEKVHCSKKCVADGAKQRYRITRACPVCGEKFEALKSRSQVFCSLECTSESKRHYNKQDETERNKYLVRDNGRTKSVARVVVEKSIGKELPAGTHVHHIDGDFTNNVLGNLYVFEGTSDHLICHRSLDSCLKELLERGHIQFEGGTYVVAN